MGEEKGTARLPVSVKVMFAMGEFGTYVLMLLNAMFLLYFYTDIIRIPPEAAAVIMMVARVWDSINDPLMGILVDKTKSKLGKCRFYLKYFSVPAGIMLALSYFCPDFNEPGKIIWLGIVYILQGMLHTAVGIPMSTLMARMTEDKYERVSLGQYKAMAVILSNFMIPAISLPLVKMLGGENEQRGFFYLAILYGVIYALTHLIAYWGTKGYEKTYEEEEAEAAGTAAEKKEKVTVLQILKALFMNKVCFMIAAGYILYQIYSAMMGGTLVFYLKYNLQNEGLMAAFSFLSTMTGIIPIFAMKILVKRFGNAGTTALACATVVVGEVCRFLLKDGVIWVLYFGWMMEGIGIALFASLLQQCMFDAMIYGEWKTGVSNQAVLMSILSFSQKFGQTIGGVVAAAMLAVVAYDPALEVQSESALRLFFAENVTVPMVLFFLLVLLFLYIGRIEKRIPQMKAEIEARRHGTEG